MLTRLLDLRLPRLGGGHDAGGCLGDASRSLLQAVQVGAVLVGLHLESTAGLGGVRGGGVTFSPNQRHPGFLKRSKFYPVLA